jgi:hypothetical protein
MIHVGGSTLKNACEGGTLGMHVVGLVKVDFGITCQGGCHAGIQEHCRCH